MTYKTRTGREYHYCKMCKIKDFECFMYCSKCGRRQRYSPRVTKEEYVRI